MTSMTRGPLPPGVYWRRRAFVLGLAMVAVLMVVGLFRGGDDGSSGDDTAAPAMAEPTTAVDLPDQSASPGDEATTSPRPGRKNRGKKPVPLGPTEPEPAEPDGTCADEDVLVSPVVENAVAGRDVALTLRLRTREAEACNWRVSPRKVTIRIRSGSDEIWTSRQCPVSVPVLGVVVRRAETADVTLTWDGRRSEDGCAAATAWALPGWYHVATSALGGEPDEVKFELAEPTPEVIRRDRESRREQQQAPDGAVEPNG